MTVTCDRIESDPIDLFPKDRSTSSYSGQMRILPGQETLATSTTTRIDLPLPLFSIASAFGHDDLCWHRLFTSGVLGDLGVRIVFNQGQTASNKWCSDSDWDQVQIALDDAMGRRRLGASAHATRQLTYCSSVCQYFAPKTCYLSGTGCRNRRALQKAHLLSQQLEGAVDTRHLYADNECAEKKNRIVNGLNGIQNDVAQTCRNLITSQHDLTCYDV
jgi:hypothetical protein